MRLAPVALLLALVCALASAQTYHIRVPQNTNLRASYSLDSSVLASARAGTTLQVVGEYNRWLRVQREGRQYWMANWVAYTRVEGQQPVASVIDNCCFVNQQCATDQEWVNGYSAFQRGECPVSQPATPGSAPVSSPANQPINNCCFVNRQCATDQEWLDGYNAFQFDNACQGTAQVSPYETIVINSAGRRIPIRGNADARQAIAAGFYYVRDALGQRWWQYIEILDDIRYSPGRCSRGYACSNRRHRFIHLDTRHPLSPWAVAATLIHEACHLWQVRENRHHGRDYSIPYHDRPWERECEAKEREAGL